VRRISQREFRNASAAVMDAVERGESFRITRHGAVVAELRPAIAEAFVDRAEAKAAFAHLPAGGFRDLRDEADAVFGEDRVDGGP
jgi:antitoxin (DNA-binding transcriptional repressor) of toxin-antitoxin stability system